jgi:hypothetical protein
VYGIFLKSAIFGRWKPDAFSIGAGVKLVDGGVGDGVGGVTARPFGDGATDAVCDQNVAQFAGICDGFEFHIGRVEAAHEAQPDQMLPSVPLSLDDGGGVCGGKGQRLFAKDGLSGGDGGQGEFGMG